MGTLRTYSFIKMLNAPRSVLNRMKSNKTSYIIISLFLLLVAYYLFDANKSSNQLTSVPIRDSTLRKCANISYTISEDDYFITYREEMIQKHLASRDIYDKKVLEVMGRVPRQELVPASVRKRAYADSPQPIGYGQTISQPYIVALMTQSLDLQPEHKVLEIGTGSGYQAAVLAEIVDEVYTMEIIEPLAAKANESLKRLGYCNVRVKNGDGYYGWEQFAPYDAIIITAAVDHVPPHLLDQLTDNGSLILPLGSTKYYQTLTIVEKKDGRVQSRYITQVRFVPMTGEALKH